MVFRNNDLCLGFREANVYLVDMTVSFKFSSPPCLLFAEELSIKCNNFYKNV